MKKPCVWPGVAPVVDRDAGLLQALGVGLALVAQHVVLGGEDDGGRQAGEVRGPAAARRRARARRAASGT